jgi:hypothetical protein
MTKHEAQKRLAEYIEEYTGRVAKQGNAIRTFTELWNAFCAVKSVPSRLVALIDDIEARGLIETARGSWRPPPLCSARHRKAFPVQSPLKDERKVRPEIQELFSLVAIKFNFEQRCPSRSRCENSTFNYFL